MTDAEDKPEPPPRQIEWLSFSGVSELNHVEAEVRVAVSGGLDPYRAETLHVMARRSPAGPSYVQYLTNRGTWNSVRAGTEVPDSGFEVPPGFADALKNAFQGELKQVRQERDEVQAQLVTLNDLVAQQLADRQRVIDAAVKATEASTGAIVALSDRLAKQEVEIHELREELEEERGKR